MAPLLWYGLHHMTRASALENFMKAVEEKWSQS